MLTIENLSGEGHGGGDVKPNFDDHRRRVAVAAQQPLLTHAKGDKQAQIESIDSEDEDKPSSGHRVASAPIAIPGRPASPAPRAVKGGTLKDSKGAEEVWKLVPMQEEHLDDVLRIQRACYEPEYREDRQSYIDRMRIYPQGNVVLLVPDPTASNVSPSTPPSPTSPAASKKRKKDDKWVVAGYILAQPFYRGEINDVNDVKFFSRWIEERAHLPRTDNDCIYIHEISVDPAFRGRGLARPLTDYTEQLARAENFKWLTLVALGPALGFWKRTGYTLERDIDYGGHTCYYMEKASGLLP